MKNIKLFIGLLILLSLLTPAFSQEIFPHQPVYYGFYWNNQLIGYSAYHQEKSLNLLGEKFYKLVSESQVKLKLSASIQMQFESQIMLKADYTPANFMVFQNSGQNLKNGEIECIFSDALVAQKVYLGQDGKEFYDDLKGKTYLYFSNFWGKFDTLPEHYQVLALKAGKKSQTLNVYDPVYRETGSMGIKYKGMRKFFMKGRELQAHLYEFNGPLSSNHLEAYFDKEYKLLKLSQINGPLSLVMAEPQIAQELAKSPELDLWAKRVALSPIYFPQPQKINRLMAKINLQAGDSEELNLEEKSLIQKFSGEAKDGQVEGDIDVKVPNQEINQGDPIQLKGFDRNLVAGAYPAEVQPFIQPEMGLEAADTPILNKAMEIAWGNPDSLEIAKALNQWVYEQIKEGEGLPSAKLTLEAMSGGAESRSYLLTALLRSLGIPARPVNGMIFSAGYFIPHYWTQIYFKNLGWLPFDPSSGEAVKLSALHITVSSKGEIGEVKEVSVKDFYPKPPEKVAHFPQEIKWPMGEQRVYEVLLNDQPLWEDRAGLGSLEILNGEEAYSFTEELVSAAETSKASVKYNLYGLPLLYQAGDEEFQFGETGIKIDLKKQDKKWLMPCSFGTYLADSRFFAQWFLMLEQAPLTQEGKKIALHAFDPARLSWNELTFTVGKEEERDRYLVGIAEPVKIKAVPITCSDGRVFYTDSKGIVFEMVDSKQKIKVRLREIKSTSI